jgi:hypothetical protein
VGYRRRHPTPGAEAFASLVAGEERPPGPITRSAPDAGRKEASVLEPPTTPTPSLSGSGPKHPNGGSLPPLPRHQLRYTLLVTRIHCSRLYRS